MKIRRRELIKLGLAATAATVARSSMFRPSRAFATPTSSKSGSRPRYLVMIFLSGGIDSVFTTDPKRRRDVERDIDVPYSAKEILEVSSSLQLGPHLAPLRAHAGHMAIVNGVLVGTANHQTGTHQFIRQKTGVHHTMPALFDLVGARRDGQPLGSASVGMMLPRDFGFDMFGTSSAASTDLFRLTESTDPDDLRHLARVLRQQADRLGSGFREQRTGNTAQDVAAFFERVAEVGPVKPQQWGGENAFVSSDLQRALWVLENDLARTVYVHIGFNAWDSHRFNTAGQVEHSGAVMPLLAKFLDRLAEIKNDRGSLLDQTTIVAGSDVGRFPRLNEDNGKDHFPEAPVLLFGAGVSSGGKGASFGATGRKMEALPVSLKTGHAGGPGPQGKIVLDDIGATLLYLCGVRDPSKVGYPGRILEFLLT